MGLRRAVDMRVCVAEPLIDAQPGLELKSAVLLRFEIAVSFYVHVVSGTRESLPFWRNGK